MTITNQERIGKALDLLRQGVHPVIEREAPRHVGHHWQPDVGVTGVTCDVEEPV